MLPRAFFSHLWPMYNNFNKYVYAHCAHSSWRISQNACKIQILWINCFDWSVGITDFPSSWLLIRDLSSTMFQNQTSPLTFISTCFHSIDANHRSVPADAHSNFQSSFMNTKWTGFEIQMSIPFLCARLVEMHHLWKLMGEIWFSVQ